MEHSLLGDDDEGIGRGVLAEGDHLLGRADFISQQTHGLRALRMGHHEGVGMLTLCSLDAVTRIFHVNVAGSLPEIHGAACLLHDPSSEILIWNEEYVAIFGSGLDYLYGVATSTDDIGEGLHSGAAVDVGNDEVVLLGMLIEISLQFVGWAGIGEGTSGLHVGDHDGLGGAQDLGRLTHEVDAAKDDDIGIGLGGFLTQAEGIPDKVRNLLDLLDLVVVRENNGIPLLLQPENLCGKVGGMG